MTYNRLGPLRRCVAAIFSASACLANCGECRASSHREAPLIASAPSDSVTDVYFFASDDGQRLSITYSSGGGLTERTSSPADADFTNDADPYGPPRSVLTPADREMLIRLALKTFEDDYFFGDVASTNFAPVTSLIVRRDNLGAEMGVIPVEDGASPDERIESRITGFLTPEGVLRTYFASSSGVESRLATLAVGAGGMPQGAVSDVGVPGFAISPSSDLECPLAIVNCPDCAEKVQRREFCFAADSTGSLNSYLLDEGAFVASSSLNPTRPGQQITGIATSVAIDKMLIGWEDFGFGVNPRVIPVDPDTGAPRMIDGAPAEPRDVNIPGFSIVQSDDLDLQAVPGADYIVATLGAIESADAGFNDVVYAYALNYAGIAVSNPTLISTTQDGSDTPLFGPTDTKFGSSGVFNSSRNTVLFTWQNFRGPDGPIQAIQHEFHFTEPNPPPTDTSGPGNGVLLGGIKALVPTGPADSSILYSNNFGTPGQSLETLGVVVSGPGASADLVADPFPANNPEPNQVLQVQFDQQAEIRTEGIPISRTFFPRSGGSIVLGEDATEIQVDFDFRFAVDQEFIDQQATLKFEWSTTGPNGDVAFLFDVPTSGVSAESWYSFADATVAQTGQSPTAVLDADDAAIIGGGFESTHSSMFIASSIDDPTVWIDNLAITFRAVMQALDGDFDADDDVDGADFLAWQRGESPAPLSGGDLADWEAGFGAVAAHATAAKTPEPTSLCLALICLCASATIFLDGPQLRRPR